MEQQAAQTRQSFSRQHRKICRRSSVCGGRFNTEKEDGTLYIVFSDFLGETYVNDPKKAEVLEQIIAAKTGRKVKVKMILQADEHVVNTRLSKVQVEEALENLVHADIEIEDD